jgi:hypothetical protein
MAEIETLMISQAAKKYNKIFPCQHKETFDECFTRHEDKVFFWFNTEDQSTHVLVGVIEPSNSQNPLTIQNFNQEASASFCR